MKFKMNKIAITKTLTSAAATSHPSKVRKTEIDYLDSPRSVDQNILQSYVPVHNSRLVDPQEGFKSLPGSEYK